MKGSEENIANHNSNYPTNAINNMPIESRKTGMKQVNCIRELANKGKPQNVEELKTRIDDYFSFCMESGCVVGIETLSLALGVSRQQLWNYCRGNNCNDEWAETCRQARQLVIAFTEQCMLQNKVPVPSSIFLLKNIAGYRDNFEICTTSDDPISDHNAISLEEVKRALTQQGRTNNPE